MRSLVVVVLALSACAEDLVAPAERHDAPAVALDGVGIAHGEVALFEPLGPPYPIILVHGFSGFSEAGPVAYFFEVKDHLEALGNDVTAPALPPVNASDQRARVLATVVDDHLHAPPRPGPRGSRAFGARGLAQPGRRFSCLAARRCRGRAARRSGLGRWHDQRCLDA